VAVAHVNGRHEDVLTLHVPRPSHVDCVSVESAQLEAAHEVPEA
jgi:hypothetical protein